MRMRPFFKRRSINGLLSRSHSFLTGPAFIKFVLLSTALTFVFYFKFWAANQPLPALPAPSDSSSAVRGRTIRPIPPLDKENSARIDINTASSEELESLPGVGPRTADEIIRHRSRYGPFRELGDLLKIKGIGSKKIERLQPHVRFASEPAGKENIE